jgi:leader peptidase (prepilin peptidase) / N-methyltransferase
MTDLPTYWVWIYAFALGACIGSFLNVCVYRWPAEQSVLRPRSRCPGCEQPIRWYDNIPILSYLFLRGRCRNCGARISAQYPFVELLVALIWLGAAIRFGLSVEALRSALFLTLLLGIALTDAREMVIPDQFSLGGTAIGLLLAALSGGFPFMRALAGAALGYFMLWGVKLAAEKALKKPALGIGDIHMMAMVGAFVGPAGALVTIFLGSLLGLVIGVPFTLLRGQLKMLGTYLPLGVFLALGAAVAHGWGDLLVRWYAGMVGL